MDRELCFENDGAEYEALMVPDEQVLRPFFFMRLIQKSITEGAYLTEFLFVPKAVWMQERFQIYEIEKKLQLLDHLKRET